MGRRPTYWQTKTKIPSESWCTETFARTESAAGGGVMATTPKVDAFPTPMSAADVCAALEVRHNEMTAEELTHLVQSNFSGSMLSLRQLKPFIEEIRRRFRHLPRKVSVDGAYKTIAGHRNFKSWCDGVLRRTDRAVRYMLAKASGDKKKSKNESEDISAVLALVGRYLTKKADKFEGSERAEFLKAVEECVRSLAVRETGS
jgi:hypothetical protein